MSYSLNSFHRGALGISIDMAATNMQSTYTFRPSEGLSRTGIRCVSYSESCNTLLCTHNFSNHVHLLHFGSGKLRSYGHHSRSVRDVKVHGDLIYSASWDSTIRAVNFHTLDQVVVCSDAAAGRSPHCALSPDERYLFSIHYDIDRDPLCRTNIVRQWDSSTGALIRKINETGEIMAGARSGSSLFYNGMLIVISDSGFITRVHPGTGEITCRCFIHENLRTGCISTWHRMIFIGDIFGRVHMVNADSLELIRSFQLHEEDITSLKMVPGNPDLLVSCGFDGKVHVFDVVRMQEVSVISADHHHLWSMTFVNDLLLTGGDENDIFIIDLKDPCKPKVTGRLNVFHSSYILTEETTGRFFTSEEGIMDVYDHDGNPLPDLKQKEYLVKASNSPELMTEIFGRMKDGNCGMEDNSVHRHLLPV